MLAGKLPAIRRYCETDVLNTYLIFLRFERMRGRLDRAGLRRRDRSACARCCAASGEPHHAEFLARLGAEA